jgi:hypothetical protein
MVHEDDVEAKFACMAREGVVDRDSSFAKESTETVWETMFLSANPVCPWGIVW